MKRNNKVSSVGLQATVDYDAMPSPDVDDPSLEANFISVEVEGRATVREVDRILAVTVGYDANGQLASVVFAEATGA